MADPAVLSLERQLLERMEHWSGSSVSAPGRLEPTFWTASQGLLDVLTTGREPLLAWLDQVLQPTEEAGGGRWPTDPIGFLATRLLRWLQSKNQYLDLSATVRARACRLYGASAAALRAGLAGTSDDVRVRVAIEEVLASHQQRLATFLDELAHSPDLPTPTFLYREAICGSYSPALQLRVLGLDIGVLAEPIVDLGCGEHGTLVRALHAAGLAAVGLDRLADADEQIIAADWFDCDLGEARWGTIISHLAFSQQFLHQHLRGGSGPERYARTYMHLLRALRVGGTFVYAPSLPFMEELLPPSRWRVARRPVPLRAPATSAAALLLDLPFQVSHVMRVA
jgi:hypothetical protein